MIERLSYFSSLARGYDLHDLERIALQSELRNRANEISSMMLFAHGSIFQFLEGPPEPLAKLFEKIKNDPRHTGLIPLTHSVSESRLTCGTRLGFWGQSAANLPAPLFPFRSCEQVKRHICDDQECQEQIFLDTFLRNSSCAA